MPEKPAEKPDKDKPPAERTQVPGDVEAASGAKPEGQKEQEQRDAGKKSGPARTA